MKNKKKGAETIKLVVMALAAFMFLIVAVVYMLFSTFLCAISVGFLPGCKDKELDDQIISNKEITALAQRMKEIREDTNKTADNKGASYQNRVSIATGKSMVEAEIHLLALLNTSHYALLGITLTDEVIEKEYAGSNLEKMYFTMKEIKANEEEENSKIAKRAKKQEWTNHDWISYTQFLAQSCYLVGDEEGFLGKLFGTNDTPCKTINEAYRVATWSNTDFIPLEEQGMIAKTKTVKEEYWVCEALPVEEEEEEEEKHEEEKEPITPSAPVEKPKNPVIENLEDIFKIPVAQAADEMEIIKRGENPCGEGFEGIEKEKTTVSVVKMSLIDVLFGFEQYSIFDEKTINDDSYVAYIQYVLMELYEEAFNEDMAFSDVAGLDYDAWLIPMEEGTYLFTSDYGIQTKAPFHYGNDLTPVNGKGVAVYAPKAGTVIFANASSDSPRGKDPKHDKDVKELGGAIVLQTDDGYQMILGHLNRENILVKTGERITRGQLIGLSGNAGDAKTPHLHIGICKSAPVAFGCFEKEDVAASYIDPQNTPTSYTYSKKASKEKTGASVAFYEKAVADLKKTPASKQLALLQKDYIMPGLPSGGLYIGQVTYQFELGFRSSGYCSSGEGDKGGVSCGVIQISTPSQPTFLKWLHAKGEQQPYNTYYQMLKNVKPGSEQWKASWQSIAKLDEEGFTKVQFEYALNEYYTPNVNWIKKQYGIDWNERSVASQEMLLSLNVQHGLTGGQNVLKKVFASTGKTASEQTFINALYKERSKVSNGELAYFTGNSMDVQRGVYNRLRYNEPCVVLALYKNPSIDLKTQGKQTGCIVKNVAIGK